MFSAWLIRISRILAYHGNDIVVCLENIGDNLFEIDSKQIQHCEHRVSIKKDITLVNKMLVVSIHMQCSNRFAKFIGLETDNQRNLTTIHANFGKFSSEYMNSPIVSCKFQLWDVTYLHWQLCWQQAIKCNYKL